MKFDLVIVGGGLAGAALAVALRGSRFRIALVEGAAPARPAGWDARVYAYSPANADFLGALGVWQALDPARLCAVRAMDVHGDGGGRLRFSAYGAGLAELAWIGESSLVHHELWECVRRQHNVTLFCPGRPAALALDDAGAHLTLDDGRRLNADLLVGADGRDSWVRHAAGIAAEVVPYGEMGVVANFRCEHAHHGVATQWFRKDGVLAWLPLPGRLMSMVWSVPDAFAAELMAMDTEAFCDFVAAAGGHGLGRLELETPRAAFALRLMRVDTVVKPHIALVGDAAHAIHPLSGHGINLGFQDARALADLLTPLPAWRNPGEIEVLRGYARARAEEPFLLQYLTHGLNRLFTSTNPVLGVLRNAGMNLTGGLPVLANALTRYAVGGKF